MENNYREQELGLIIIMLMDKLGVEEIDITDAEVLNADCTRYVDACRDDINHKVTLRLRKFEDNNETN